MIERRTDLQRIANMSEDEESAMKQICQNYATEITYNRDFEYYSVRFTEAAWLLAVLADPDIERYLT